MLFKKKVKPILTDEDIIELKTLENKAYMDSARNLVKLRGEERAKIDLSIKQKKEEKW